MNWLTPLRASLLCAALALVHRLVLARVYFGQEEGDYGNLGLILGTVQSNFSYIETEHMPMYTWMAAALCVFTGDAHTAGLAVSVLMGTLAAGLITYCAARWLSLEAGIVTGLLMAFQPDLALTSATTLRASTYTAWAAATLLAVGRGRWIAAGLLFGGAFLTRFDAMASLLPVLLLAAFAPRWLGTRRLARARYTGAALAASWIALWAAVYSRIEGTPRFWSGVASRNTGNFDDLGLLGRLGKGAETLWLVAGKVLPDHVGWAVLALAPLGLVYVGRGRAQEIGPARVLALTALSSGGVFALLVVLSAYRWDHNLYWSWLSVALPCGLAVAAFGGTELVGQLPLRSRAKWLLALGLALATALPMYRQTWQQLIRSEQWLGTQVRLANWAESALPEGSAMLADVIPATWPARRADPPPILRWSQLGDEPPPDDPDAFGQWLVDQNVRVIFWFREEWIGAAARAPFLADGGTVQVGDLTLTEVGSEAAYGVIAYRVDGAGLAPLRATVQ